MQKTRKIKKRYALLLVAFLLCVLLGAGVPLPVMTEESGFSQTFSGEEWEVELEGFEGVLSVELPCEAEECYIVTELREGQVQVRWRRPSSFHSAGESERSYTTVTLIAGEPASGRVSVRFAAAG